MGTHTHTEEAYFSSFFLTGLDALLQRSHDPIHITGENRWERNHSTAPGDDLIAQLPQQHCHTLWSVIKSADIPDHADTAQDGWKEVGDLLWMGFGKNLAWILQA